MGGGGQEGGFASNYGQSGLHDALGIQDFRRVPREFRPSSHIRFLMHPEIILGCYFFFSPRPYYREQFDPGLKNRKLFGDVNPIRMLNG